MPETQTLGNRRAPRYYLGGVVELTDLDSGRMKVALVRALSLYGCLVKTEMPVKTTARVALKDRTFWNSDFRNGSRCELCRRPTESWSRN